MMAYMLCAQTIATLAENPELTARIGAKMEQAMQESLARRKAEASQ